MSWRRHICVPWREYTDYTNDDDVYDAIFLGVVGGVTTAPIVPDYTEPGYGEFDPLYGDDTLTYMENLASRAVVDYLAQMGTNINAQSVKITSTDTRGSLNFAYVYGTAGLDGPDDLYWLARVTDEGDVRVLYIRSDQYGDFVTQ